MWDPLFPLTWDNLMSYIVIDRYIYFRVMWFTLRPKVWLLHIVAIIFGVFTAQRIYSLVSNIRNNTSEIIKAYQKDKVRPKRLESLTDVLNEIYGAESKFYDYFLPT